MHIAVHKDIPESLDVRQGWNAVASQMDYPEVFYTWEWAAAVQSAYRASPQPLLLLGYEGNELVGIASLCTGNGNSEIKFLAANTADYCDFLSAPVRREAFVNAVLVELRKLNKTFLTLTNLPADSPTQGALQTSCAVQGFCFYSRPAYLCARVELGEGEERQKLKTGTAGKKKLRRYLREMEREGPLEFAHLQSHAEIQKVLPAFAEAHVARFHATGKVSSLSTPERRLFLDALARYFDGQRVVTLSLLKVGDDPVAWNYGFQFHGSWFWYQPTFASRHEKNSPGYCLLARIVTEACDMNEMKAIDLGLGAEGYKERFGNSERQTLHITLTTSRMRHLREQLRYKAAALLKQSPRVESTLRRVLGQ